MTEDIEAVLAVTNRDVDERLHAVRAEADTLFTWDYEKGARPGLDKLYEKAKTSQWNGATDLDWSIDVDAEKVCAEMSGSDYRSQFLRRLSEIDGSPVASWGDPEWKAYQLETFHHRISQFMHGEQGALLCTARIVETVPWIDAKYYAATQVMDEARHVEVFARYLDTKLDGHYPINAHLRMLLDDILVDSRWDMTYLGMQIMVEGLALAAFGFMHSITTEPLLKRLLRYVMSDEARHVAFGVLSLQELYGELTAAELRERQEFAFEAALRMRDRFLQQEVWDRLGVDTKVMVGHLLALPAEENTFQKMLFSKIVPNCKKLGLLDAGATKGNPGWLRERFTEIGVIEFEDWIDTGEEYVDLDEVARDREAEAVNA
ncbi:MAG TPA: ferritin-like domain-containing protein [Acidimicrobiales bacterium]|nr:ferritin-like domain-containing protein [Acidimicrobiales bacterium]